MPALAALALMSPTAPAAAATAGNTAASAPLAKASAPAAAASSATKKTKAGAPVKLVDINSASRKELKTLPGVGDAEADKIIAGRPYLSKAELVAKNVMLMGPYQSIKDRVVALQNTKPKSKT